MPAFLDSRTDIKYTGYDLLGSNIEYAREQFVNETCEFQTVDLVTEDLKKTV